MSGVLPNKEPVEFCTGYVSTTALAVDPWHINKAVLEAGTQSGPCNYVTADSIVKYRIYVYKNVGTTGQLNLAGGVVLDTLPAGATLVSSTCGMTQTGNVLTWNIGNLSALPMYNAQYCIFEVLYPTALFPTNTQITNQAVITGVLGSLNQSCGDAEHYSNTTCVEIKQFTSSRAYKYVYTNGQPGCGGKYRIYINNNGSVPITSMTVTDTIPLPLSSVTIGTVSSGLTTPTLNAVPGGVEVITSLSTPLNPTQWRYIEVNFEIPLGIAPGTVIENCAYVTSPGEPLIKVCASFTVNAPAAKPCVWKLVCDQQVSYSPGDIFRYRLRVQNIGGLPITAGANIFDTLNPNLEYVGNPSYYTASSWNTPCQTTSNWTGATVNYDPTNNLVEFTLPEIPATCQSLFYNNCGMYGSYGVPFYFIEFDVMVSDTSALGNIPNNFTIEGGGITAPVMSNTNYVNVIGTAGFELTKSVSADTTNWASSAASAAGSSVNYLLELLVSPGSVGLRHITFADLLPIDDAPNDNLILGPCTSRGSLFDVSYTSTIMTAPVATDYNNPLSFSRVDNFSPAGSPAPSMFTGGCGTNGTWVSGIPAGSKNIGYYFGSTPVAATNTAKAMVEVSISADANVDDLSCNTFAANAAVRHLINSSLISDQQIGELESQVACLKVTDEQEHPCQISVAAIDSLCCCYEFSVVNPSQTDISSVTLVIHDGELINWTTTNPCGLGMTPTLPSNNVVWNFTPPCTDDIHWKTCFDATSSTGLIVTEWYIEYTDGTVCKFDTSIQCEPAIRYSCDTVTFYPFPEPNMFLDDRRFFVENQKVPQSDICEIIISYTAPDPLPRIGGFLVIGGNTAPSSAFPNPFTNIDVAGSGETCSFGESVDFNIGIYDALNYNGILTFTIIHCDGDTCTQDIKWGKHVIQQDYATEQLKIDDSLFAVTLQIKPTSVGEEVKWISIYTEDESSIFAISGSKHYVGDEVKDENFMISRSLQSQNSAMFELRNPVAGEIDKLLGSINLVFAQKEGRTGPINLHWALYNEAGSKIMQDSIIVDKSTSSVESIIMENGNGNIDIKGAYPNPTSSKTTINYNLNKADNVRISLYDEQGKFIREIQNFFQPEGHNTVVIHLQDLVTGLYHVKFETDKGGFGAIKIIVEK
ncbi:MAG: T9SS type A sorting domain-containing protein [Chlorobi bacterium]|nr:T9SS type A sorting domain-containing protein [Chlorobiota bacterium]